MENCSICINSFTKIQRKKIQCQKCKEICCLQCLKTHISLIFKDLGELSCMFCNQILDKSFLDSILSKTWFNPLYNLYRGKLLFEEQKSMLPATQQIVEMKREKFKITNEINELTHSLVVKQHIKDQEYKILEYAEEQEQQQKPHIEEFIKAQELKIKNLKIEISELTTLKRYLINQKKELDFKIDHLNTDNTPTFIRKCLQTNCRGYLSLQWQCGICKTCICQHCQEIKNEENHTCNPDNLKSVQMLAKETKPCPGCEAPIYKIDGCDMMWCVHCHAPFNWNTLKLHKGKNHNPEYYRWIRENENVSDKFSKSLTDHSKISEILLKRPDNMSEEDFSLLNVVYKKFVKDFPRRVTKTDYHLKTRIKYLMNEITEQQFRLRLQRQEKKEKYKIDFSLIENDARSIFIPLFQHLSTNPDKHKQILDQIKKTVDSLNEQFTTLARLYNYTPFII